MISFDEREDAEVEAEKDGLEDRVPCHLNVLCEDNDSVVAWF